MLSALDHRRLRQLLLLNHFLSCHAALGAAVLGPLVDGVTAEIVDGVYPGRAAALLEKTVNRQVRCNRAAVVFKIIPTP
jgi:hypothetical protein